MNASRFLFSFWGLYFLMFSVYGQGASTSPIHISLVKPNFITITNELHKGNRLGYRFHEHAPMAHGQVPLSNRAANISGHKVDLIMDSVNAVEGVFVYTHRIEKNDHWSKQDWTYYLKPVEDGIEILLKVKTYGEGLPEYYGVQQCFRMGGAGNADWRRQIALTPAFSEYDQWANEEEGSRTSLTYVLRNSEWDALPACTETVGARTPAGMAVDHLRTNGVLMEKVGPYEALMGSPIDLGLVARTNAEGNWVGGIFWENTSHVTDHHPADCIHTIINIGNIPPFSSRIIRGKIYWFKGDLEDLRAHYTNDFLSGSAKNKLTIASCQFPVSGSIDENADWIEQQMRMAKVQGAELVHFPECALSGYGGADIEDFESYDWGMLKLRTEKICELARSLHIWVLLGSTHPLSNGHKPHNSLYVINPAGRVVDRYDKRYCTGGDLDYYSPGDHFVDFKIGNIHCGLLICYDVRFPELYREYRKIGVDVLFQSFYNARHDIDCIHPKIMPLTARARAATNYFYMSLTNSSAPYSWPCYFISPDGLVDGKLEANKPGILISEIDVGKKYYDASGRFRMDAINGKLNSGTTVDDPRSLDRQTF